MGMEIAPPPPPKLGASSGVEGFVSSILPPFGAFIHPPTHRPHAPRRVPGGGGRREGIVDGAQLRRHILIELTEQRLFRIRFARSSFSFHFQTNTCACLDTPRSLISNASTGQGLICDLPRGPLAPAGVPNLGALGPPQNCVQLYKKKKGVIL